MYQLSVFCVLCVSCVSAVCQVLVLFANCQLCIFFYQLCVCCVCCLLWVSCASVVSVMRLLRQLCVCPSADTHSFPSFCSYLCRDFQSESLLHEVETQRLTQSQRFTTFTRMSCLPQTFPVANLFSSLVHFLFIFPPVIKKNTSSDSFRFVCGQR